MTGKIKVAVIQAAPVYYSLQKSLEKAAKLIHEAAMQKARVIVLGETWLPGYPTWLDHCSDAALWDHPPVKEVFAELKKNSIAVPGKETALLSSLAKKYETVIAIGVNEKNEKGREAERFMMVLDASGHYYREDIFNFSVNQPKRVI